MPLSSEGMCRVEPDNGLAAARAALWYPMVDRVLYVNLCRPGAEGRDGSLLWLDKCESLLAFEAHWKEWTGAYLNGFQAV